jgi:hypothetical protein
MELDTTKDHLDRFLQNIIDGLPAFLGALLLLLVSYIVARVLSGVTKRLLETARLNDRLSTGQGGNVIQRAVPNPSGLVASVVFWLVFLFGLSLAVSVLGIPALNDFLRGLYSYLPNILAAFLIFMVASAVSAGVVGLVNNVMGHTPTGKIVATVAPILVMSLAGFMILDQLNVAPTIVTITYAALIGSVALGMALAFGLGGRDVAARMLENAYEKGRLSSEQAKRDLQAGKANAQRKANRR